MLSVCLFAEEVLECMRTTLPYLVVLFLEQPHGLQVKARSLLPFPPSLINISLAFPAMRC